LTPQPAPVGESRVPVGFYKCVSFGGFFASIRFSSGFGFFQVLFGFISGFFRSLLGFFGFRVHPWVKNETCTQTQFYAGWIQVQPVGVKINPNPHPSDLKLTGNLKPELASLHVPTYHLIIRPVLSYSISLSLCPRRSSRGNWIF
jgi:hypothetical protein